MNSSAVSESEVSDQQCNHLQARSPYASINLPRHKTLTPLRILRGLLCLTVLLLTAFMTLIYWAPLITILLQLFSIHYSRKATSFLFGLWLALWPFLFEKINRTKVVFSGETVPARERVLLMANHRTEVDWMYLWDLALRKGRLGHIKYVLKSSLMKLPIFGWGFHIFEFIPVERKWEIDEPIMRQMLSTFADSQNPLWLAVFPEGTDFTEQKCLQNQKFAAENGLPILKNVLLPKTKGFHASVEILRSSLDAVYDITIGYKHRCPLFMDNVFGVDPAEVHIHVQRFSIHELPVSETQASAWLIERFQLKDKLLSDFAANGYFPHEGTEGELSTIKCLLNFILVFTLTSICTFLTFFSSVWFKIYVGLSCVYLASATHFKIRVPPIFSFLTAPFTSKKSRWQ
ncbi:probable 1-acyl-sn-glycerol-3-phosphate acyltransferase 5 [Aristolochia californica]|uniref:probable 1-acyl-sn-glycerol-3-phosphate acyltransferase 5 n=1 Tax=Aristolochia californica TaxID=171875 RepID=UPI0035E033FC